LPQQPRRQSRRLDDGGEKVGFTAGTKDRQEAHAALRRPKAATLFSLITEYKGSADYRRLAPSSLRAYAHYLKIIEDEFGDMPLAALEDRRVREEFKGAARSICKHAAEG
jgi:hypothetical protein